MRLIDPDVLAVVTVFQEAEGESYEAKVAVAEVIRRRMARRYSSDGTVEGTVLRPLQFSGWNAGAPNRVRSIRIDDADPIVMDCMRAWSESRGTATVPDAILYYSTDIDAPKWAAEENFVAQIGKTRFYRA